MEDLERKLWEHVLKLDEPRIEWRCKPMRRSFVFILGVLIGFVIAGVLSAFTP